MSKLATGAELLPPERRPVDQPQRRSGIAPGHHLLPNFESESAFQAMESAYASDRGQGCSHGSPTSNSFFGVRLGWSPVRKYHALLSVLMQQQLAAECVTGLLRCSDADGRKAHREEMRRRLSVKSGSSGSRTCLTRNLATPAVPSKAMLAGASRPWKTIRACRLLSPRLLQN